MKRVMLLVVLLLECAGHAGALRAAAWLPQATSRRRVVRPARPRYLWIGAHPDDEIVLAPLFGQLCVEGGADCAMLVFTRGENGECVLPGGCGDLGALRSAEMQRAAAVLNARVIQWSFPDVMSDVEAAWGSHDALVAQLANAIAAEHPDVIYTFDPAHGSSCHPAHREVGQLVVDAAGATRVVFAETAIDGMTFARATTEASAVDGSWSYVVNDARIHASQFTDADVHALESTPLKLTWIATTKPSSYLVQCVGQALLPVLMKRGQAPWAVGRAPCAVVLGASSGAR